MSRSILFFIVFVALAVPVFSGKVKSVRIIADSAVGGVKHAWKIAKKSIREEELSWSKKRIIKGAVTDESDASILEISSQKKSLVKSPAKPKLTSLSIETSPSDAIIEVMGLSEPFRQGMKLPAGDYELKIEAEGYRSKRFWVELDPEFDTLSVALNKKGIPSCNPTVIKSGSVLDSEGQIISIRHRINNSTVPELFWSFAEKIDSLHFVLVTDSKLTNEFAVMEYIQPTQLSRSDIRKNKIKYVDPERHSRSTVGIERVDSQSVDFILSMRTPWGAVAHSIEESFCEMFNEGDKI